MLVFFFHKITREESIKVLSELVKYQNSRSELCFLFPGESCWKDVQIAMGKIVSRPHSNVTSSSSSGKIFTISPFPGRNCDCYWVLWKRHIMLACLQVESKSERREEKSAKSCLQWPKKAFRLLGGTQTVILLSLIIIAETVQLLLSLSCFILTLLLQNFSPNL